MATNDNPLSAFFRGFQGAQQRVSQQEQQAVANQLNEQLRAIQLLTAQKQLQELNKTPEQRLAEQMNLAFSQQALARNSVIPAPVGIVGPVAEPQAIDFTANQLNAAQSQGNLNDLLAQVTANRQPMQFATPLPGVTGFLDSPAAAAAEVARQDVTQQAKQDSAFNQIKRVEEFKKSLEIPKPLQLDKIDVGDSIILTNPVTGEQVKTIPKETGAKYITTKQGVMKVTKDQEGKEIEEFIQGSDPISNQIYSSEQRSAVNQLYDRFQRNPYIQKATTAQGSLDIIDRGLSQKNSAGDIAAINQFQSGMVDPGATVREGDVALITKSASLVGRLNNYLPRLIKGGVLPPELRKEIGDLAQDIYNMRAKNANQTEVARQKDIAPKFGVLFEDVGKEFPIKKEGKYIIESENIVPSGTTQPSAPIQIRSIRLKK